MSLNNFEQNLSDALMWPLSVSVFQQNYVSFTIIGVFNL